MNSFSTWLSKRLNESNQESKKDLKEKIEKVSEEIKKLREKIISTKSNELLKELKALMKLKEDLQKISYSDIKDIDAKVKEVILRLSNQEIDFKWNPKQMID
jgi:uncharacterized protein YjgD (DUF1641 family)